VSELGRFLIFEPLAIRKIASGEKRFERSDASGAKCARKQALFSRLEKINMLFSGELRAFLIAGVSIRNSR
jgi:hypothetical protein